MAYYRRLRHKIPIRQPAEFTYIPEYGDENKASKWKLMSRGIEVAADKKGIYKIQSGRANFGCQR